MPARSAAFTLEGRLAQARRFLVELNDPTSYSYAFFGKATPWKADSQIDGISQSNPMVVSAAGSGLVNDDLVTISAVQGMTQANTTSGLPSRVINAAGDSFALAGVDSTSFSTYTGGGVVSQILDDNPPAANETRADTSALRHTILGYKRIPTADAVMVIPRVEWKAYEVYSSADYSDQSLESRPFYVITESNGVYKCLWNNGGLPSTVEPTATSTAAFSLTDGYRWKYMYAAAPSDIEKFASDYWMPVRDVTFDDGSDQWNVQQAAIPGTVNGINAVELGINYTTGATVTITGDGMGATASIVPTGLTGAGGISRVILNTQGRNYTWAEAFITDPAGTGCRLQVLLSPPTGDGADAAGELLARRVYLREAFQGDYTTGGIPGLWAVNIDFRVHGVVTGLLLTAGGAATADAYDARDALSITAATPTVPGATVAFNPGDTIIGATSGATAFVSGVALTTLNVSEKTGTFTPNEVINGPTGTARMVVDNAPIPNNLSGSLIYVENRTPVTRTMTQTEYLRGVLEF